MLLRRLSGGTLCLLQRHLGQRSAAGHGSFFFGSQEILSDGYSSALGVLVILAWHQRQTQLKLKTRWNKLLVESKSQSNLQPGRREGNCAEKGVGRRFFFFFKCIETKSFHTRVESAWIIWVSRGVAPLTAKHPGLRRRRAEKVWAFLGGTVILKSLQGLLEIQWSRYFG